MSSVLHGAHAPVGIHKWWPLSSVWWDTASSVTSFPRPFPCLLCSSHTGSLSAPQTGQSRSSLRPSALAAPSASVGFLQTHTGLTPLLTQRQLRGLLRRKATRSFVSPSIHFTLLRFLHSFQLHWTYVLVYYLFPQLECCFLRAGALPLWFTIVSSVTGTQ